MDLTAADEIDRHASTPFLLRLFYRTGAFHRPDEFSSRHLPPHVDIYTWPSCTLAELSMQLADTKPSLLPEPAVGTRLAFRLVFPDSRGGSVDGGPGAGPSSARFGVKDLGSVVIGEDLGDCEDAMDLDAGVGAAGHEPDPAAASKTLSESRFVVGDYISCAILPPLANGDVAPADAVRTGRGFGLGAGRLAPAPVLPPLRSGRENGSRPFPRGGREGGRDRPRRESDGFGFGSIPTGEWRRGERLPDASMERGRRSRGGGGRW